MHLPRWCVGWAAVVGILAFQGSVAAAALPDSPDASGAQSAAASVASRPEPAAPKQDAIAPAEPPPAGFSASGQRLPNLEPPARRFQLGLEALTDFPIQVGGRLWIEVPHRIRFAATFGYLPGPYVDTINAFLVAVGAYDQDTAGLIKAALTQSLIVRLHGGWRPFRRRGAYFELGYGLAALGGGLTGSQAIAAVTGTTPPTDPNESRGYDVQSILHLLDIELGWQWPVWRGLTFRVALGAALTVWSNTTVTPRFQPRLPGLQEQFTSAAEQYLDNTYRSYVFTPTVTFAAGWRFLPWLARGW